MQSIKTYKDFILNEARKTPYTYRGYPSYNDYSIYDYPRRSKKYGLSGNSTILQKTENFFEKIEDRINRAATIASQSQQYRRNARGTSSFNTGIESIFSLPSVIPNVLKRIFGPNKFNFGKDVKTEKDIDLNLMKHLNDSFIKKDLPKIRYEKEMEDNIEKYYKKAGMKRGESPVIDEIARNRVSTFYEKQANPNQLIFTNK